jgi:hypothetical protein
MLIGYQQIASLLKMGAQPDFVPIVIPAKKKLSIFPLKIRFIIVVHFFKISDTQRYKKFVVIG